MGGDTMTKRRIALTHRDVWTCSYCWYLAMKENRPYCTRNGDFNRWNIFQFGCGEYAITNSGEVEIQITLACYGARF